MDATFRSPLTQAQSGGDILTPHDPQMPESQLEEVAQHLLERKQHRLVILFVEKWSANGRPTPSARLALAQAYLQLRLLDPAWIRLKELLDHPTLGHEATKLSAELFLLRGWQDRARVLALEALEQQPDDAELQHIATQADATPPEPEALAEGEAPPADLIKAAELHMARGAFVRARALLERARRRAQPRKIPRVEELLWALRGEFATDASLLELYHRLLPTPEPQPSEPTVPLPTPGETEIAGVSALTTPERDEGDGFRGLFRDLEEAAEAAEDNDEVTAISQLAPPEALAALSELDEDDEDTDPGYSDTEIMRIVRKGEPLRRVQGPVHTTPPQIDEDFDLARYRDQLGASVPDSDYALDRDDEDDNLVIVTGQARSTDQDDTLAASIVAVDRDAAREDEARGLQGSADESWASPPQPDLEITQPLDRPRSLPPGERPQALAPIEPPPEPTLQDELEAELSASDLQPIEPNAWPWWGAALALVLAGGVVLFGALSMIAAL